MAPRPSDPELDWTAEGAPRSTRFDDVYFSRGDGLAETRAVFLDGCGLPQAWAGRRRFTVGELGFGTGLNILALLDLWRRTRPEGGRLSIFSVEGFPLSRDEAARALAAWPELADLAGALVQAWPRRAPGLHRIAFPALDAVLDLAVGEALWALEQWDGRADAWFLDGFSPARNPQMWRPEVLAAVAARSSPGARVGTFTVAGAVRRGLQDAGFAIEKRPGHGAKRERLEGHFPGDAPLDGPWPSVAVIGAGIAGAALVRALRAEGIEPLLIEADTPGAGASGNPAALVAPALDAGGGARAQVYAQAFARAVDLYRAVPGAVISQGVCQREATERDGGRFDAVLAGGLFEDGALQRAPGALIFTEGLAVRPGVVLQDWLSGVPTVTATAASLERREGRWAILDAEGGEIGRSDAIVIAAGAAATGLLGEALPLTPVRGQASWVPDLTLDQACAWGGYALPMDGGVLFGATHDRGRTDIEVNTDDHARNLATLALAFPDLATAAGRLPLAGRAGIRAAAFDYMPVAGPVAGMEGVHVLSGLGSRGFTLAPLLAEHLAARLAGGPSPLPLSLQPAIDTARLLRRR